MENNAWWEDNNWSDTLEADVEAGGGFEVEETSNRDIAIIGMAVRLPQADDVHALWDRIAEGCDAVGSFPEARKGDAEALLAGTRLPEGAIAYYDGAYLEEIDKFDFRYFRLSPKEAALMNPNQRLWLETAWSAIENAGYGGRKLSGTRTGVYLGYNGDAFHDYKRLIAEKDPASLSLAIPGNLSSIVAGRLSYLLDLQGPAMTVDTACSSSLVALHLAVQALRNGECETAIVGGVKTYLLPVDLGIKIGIESSDSRARTFDDTSDGTGGGEGVAAVLLKPLGQALRDRDAIYAVIKGTATNQDGASVGITAPNVLAQEAVIASAWQDAGIDPGTIGYIEAHGTGTKLGDPIEIAGLSQAFRRYTDRKQFCAVGSLKTNFGHLDTAAGLVGLIKAVLALHRRQLPPMLHFRDPNRDISFVDSPVYVSDMLRPWEREGDAPRRAGVSSFGMSGTNVHAVLEEAPEAEPVYRGDEEGRTEVLALSARTEAALGALIGRYARFLEQPNGQTANWRDVCYTANTGRGHDEYRAAISASSIGELQGKLARLEQRLQDAALSGEDLRKAWNPEPGVWAGRIAGDRAQEAWSVERIQSASPDTLCSEYVEGESWDWEAMYRDTNRRKVHLPAYPFERTRCWVEASPASALYRVPDKYAGALPAREPEQPIAAQSVTLSGRDEDAYSDTERAVAEVWGRVLGLSAIGLHDHYYELGGDSILGLQISGLLSARFSLEVGVAELIRHPTVAALSEFIDGSKPVAEANPATEVTLSAQDAVFALSRSQVRLYLAAQQPGADIHHHMTLAYVVDGPMDADRLQAAFASLAKRHESLRTTFEWSEEGEPIQRVHPDAELKVEHVQLSSEEEWHSYAAGFVQPFDLTRLPLLRIGLASVSPERHLLVLDTHHLIADGASLALLLQELTALYGGLPLPFKRAEYRDYVRLQRERMESEELRRMRDYWLEDVLAGSLPELRLPLDFPRPATKLRQGRLFRFTLPAVSTEKLHQLAKRRQASMHTVLFSLYSLLMHRYTGQEELIVGSLVNGREQREFRDVVGLFMNFLPIRLRMKGEHTFAELLEETGRRTLQAYDNGQFPFDEMIAGTNAASNRSRNPLYDTMLVFHNHAAGSERFTADGLQFTELPLERETSALDVKMDLFPGATGELRGVIEYDTALFREETISRMAAHFVQLAEAVVGEEDPRLGSIELFEPGEEAELARRRQLNDGAAPVQGRRLSVRVAATFTAEPAAKPLKQWLAKFGYAPEVTFAPYNQIFQFLTEDEAEDQAAPTVLLVRPEDWLSPSADALARLENDLERLAGILKGRVEQGPHFVALMPFDAHGPLAALPEETTRRLRERWAASLAGAAHVHLLDLADTAARYRVRRIEDPVAFETGRIPYTEDYYAAVGTEIARALIGWHGHPFKMIVVDADNTLWRGVCGEDGPTGVVVSPPYEALQRLLLRKRAEGFLLALCSKNNEADLWETFERNPGMVLRREHFAAWRVNWSPKHGNLRELAEELNLGVDSFMFLDDNAAECMAMMAECPDVLTLKLPDETEIPSFLAHVWAWDRLRVTDEDRRRADGYTAERRRQADARSGDELSDYLRSLELKVSLRQLMPDETERAAQLTARTNQFNLNGVRYSEAEIKRLMQEGRTRQWIVEAADRYGEYGRIGYLLAEARGSALAVNSFLLSCRVLGRGVEQAVLAGLKRYAQENGCTELRAAFRRTAKNKPFEQFLADTGWIPVEEESSAVSQDETFIVPIDRVAEVPAHVEYVEGIRLSAEEALGETAATETERVDLSWLSPNQRTAVQDESEESPEPYRWVLSSIREESLAHGAYLMPLRFPDAADIADMAIEWRESMTVRSELPYAAPVGETETALAKLWERIIGGGPYGRHEHFFDAGGDSLQAATLVSHIARTFGVRVTLIDLFDHPRLSLMAELITGQGGSAQANAGQLPKAPEAELYPVSPAQRRMYFLQQFDPEGGAYQIPTVLQLSGAIDRDRMKKAFLLLAERHEALRTSFEQHDGEPCQRIHPEPVIDWTEDDVAEDESLNEAIRAFVRPFELRHAPLFRVGLFRQSEQRNTLVFDIHHIIADGVSVNVLVHDFIRLYGGEELPPLTRQYKDYAVWLQSTEQKARIDEQLDWWMTRLAGPIPKLELHGDAARPAIKSTAGSQLVVHLDKQQTSDLNRLAQRSGATLFMLLLSAYAVWLAKLSRQPEVVIGTPMAGRTNPDTESMVGVFVNALPIRISTASNQAFPVLLEAVKAEVLGALDRQEAPFEELVERLQPARDMTRNPLFDAMFSMLNMAHADLSASGVTIEPAAFDFGVSQFDIGLYVLEEDTGLTITVQYASAIYGEKTMRHWTNALRTLLLDIVRKPAAELGELELLTSEERKRVVHTFNETLTPYSDTLTLQEMFRRQAERSPEQFAAAFTAEESLTYRELNARAERIARRLLAAGLAPEEPVGLMVERSAAMMAGMLGILLAGGAYVPLPPDFPADRLRYMAEDCGLRIVLSQRRWLEVAERAAPNALTIDLDEPEGQAAVTTDSSLTLPEGSAEQLAYILYTSGSTGRPKGVMIRHRSVINRLSWMQKAYPLQDDDVILQKTPYSFDVSVWELFWWAMAGASVAFLEPGAEKDPSRLIEAIGRHRATTMHFVPSMLAAFLEAAQAEPRDRLREQLRSLRRVFASGEALQRTHVDRFYALMRELGLEHVKLVNLYGPTEATVDVSVYECEADSPLDFVPIGRPIDNTSLYVVSPEGLSQPIGVPGELCIGGVQLAKGYVNRTDLTEEKFVPNPFVPGEVMYRTGDLARWMEDGQVQYLGRIDDQVKIRGYRIELGEIERTLLLHEAVSEAVAAVRDDGSGGKRICAYVVAERSLTSGELRRHCAERLPDYMIPAAFAQLTAMPLTASGKADRKALPEPEGTMDTGTAYAAPAGETERRLAAMWEELLQREQIGANDDFFELGGHSLKATAMAARIETEFGVRLPLKEIFTHPTVAQLAALLTDGTAQAAHEPIPRAPAQPYYPVTSTQKQMLIHEGRNPGTLSYHMPAILVINGKLDEHRLHTALRQLTERHEALRTSFGQAEGRMVQRVHERVDVVCERIEPAAFFGDDDAGQVQAACRWLKPFDLARPPLFRTAIVPLSEDRHLFLFDIHHLVSDGMTNAILIAELAAIYDGQTLPTVPVQFKDYSEWLADRSTGEEKERHIRYWLDRFSDGVPTLELPADEERAVLSDPQARDEACQYQFHIPEELTERLAKLARQSGATLSMVLLAAYQALLGYWSGSNDVVTGVPAAGRSHPDLAYTAGLLLQTFAIRNRPERTLSFESWLAEVKRSMLEAFDNPWMPMDELVERLDEQGLIRWDTTRHPLFDTMFVMNNFEQPTSGSGELGWEPLDWPVLAAKTDLVLQAEERDGSLKLVLEYRSRLFRRDTVREMADALLALLAQAADNPGASLETLTGAPTDSHRTEHEEVPAGSGGLFDSGFSF